MSDIAVEQSKPTKPPSLLSLSFGGFNSIAIVTSSISILRLITAHEKITLNGIVGDVVEWYKRFFHQSFDAAIEWVNALNLHWLHLPYVQDGEKDLIIFWSLGALLAFRGWRAITKLPRFKLEYPSVKADLTLIIFVLAGPMSLYVVLLLLFMFYAIPTFRRSPDASSVRRLYFLTLQSFLLQMIAASVAVGSMLVLSAYS
jgi:hypothetical protein